MPQQNNLEFGLDSSTLNKIRSTLVRYPQIERAIVYGSRAKGNFKPGSDIDLTLEGKDLSLSLLLQLENNLDDLLLPYKFDISIHGQIDDVSLLEHIERVGKTFYQKGK